MKKRIATFLLACMMLCSMSIFAMATDVSAVEAPEVTDDSVARASDYLTSYFATISSSGGNVKVEFVVTGTAQMDQVGAIEVAIYNNTTGILATKFYSRNNPTMLGSNRMYYSSSVTYENANVGDEYYAVVQCYAEKDGGSDTKPYTTGFVTCKN